MRVHGVRIIGARGDRIITRNNILTYTAVLSLSFPLSLSHASAHTLHLFFSLFLSRCVDYKCLDFARDGIKLNFSNDTERSVRAPLLFFSLPLTRPLLSSKPARRNANISAVFPYTYAGNLAHALRSFFSLSFSLFSYCSARQTRPSASARFAGAKFSFMFIYSSVVAFAVAAAVEFRPIVRHCGGGFWLSLSRHCSPQI